MNFALNNLKIKIDGIKKHLIYAENLQKVLLLTKNGAANELKEPSDYLRNENTSERTFNYRSNIISLYGAFEHFIEEITKEYVDELLKHTQHFSQLNEKIQKNYFTKWKSLSEKLSWSKYAHLDDQKLIVSLHESFIQDKLSSVSRMNVRYGKQSQSEILNSVIGSDIDKLNDTIENLDPVAFEAAVDTILESKHIYVIGLRSCEPLARFLHFYLSMVRPDVILVSTTSVSEIFEQMIRINSDDCVIGISFPRYSMRTLKAMEFANDRNAKVITITDTVHSPMNLYSSCNLLARSDMVSIVDSLVAPLSVINALVVALVLKSPQKTRENLKELEMTWNNYQVYLNDEINFIGDEPMLDVPLRRLDS